MKWVRAKEKITTHHKYQLGTIEVSGVAIFSDNREPIIMVHPCYLDPKKFSVSHVPSGVIFISLESDEECLKIGKKIWDLARHGIINSTSRKDLKDDMTRECPDVIEWIDKCRAEERYVEPEMECSK